jgi:DNA-directed RNA polymerase subunit omega
MLLFVRFLHLRLAKRSEMWFLTRPRVSLAFFLNMLPDNIIPFDQPKSDNRYPALPMKSELVYKAAEIIDDPQKLINLVSKRVRQLNSGRSPLIPTVPSMGAADIALTEIIEGKIRILELPAEQA